LEQVAQILVLAIAWGSIYALIALGYTMVYGVLKLINFAHGDIYMIGAFAGLFAARALGYSEPTVLGTFVVLVTAMAACAALGVVIERAAYKPLRTGINLGLLLIILAASVCFLAALVVVKLKARGVVVSSGQMWTYRGLVALAAAVGGLAAWGYMRGVLPKDKRLRIFRKSLGAYQKATRLTALITAIGVSFLLEMIGIIYFGAKPQAFPTLVPQTPVHLFGNVTIARTQILILVSTAVLLIGLRIVVMHTKVGRAMRAVSYDRETAALMGVNVNGTISFTFGLGSALAAAAGVLVALVNTSIEPLMGIIPGLKAFVAAVLGGIGNITGAAVGGFIVGITEGMVKGSAYSSYTDAVAFVILIIILLLRPTGIIGGAAVEKA
jgi:branched-chain amino acid transport system permease protein